MPWQCARDIAWDHGTQLEGNRLWWKCKWCDLENKSGGVTRLKQHLAGGYRDVQKCPKCPRQIARTMREHLDSNKTTKILKKMEARMLEEALMSKSKQSYTATRDDDSDESDSDEISILEKQKFDNSVHEVGSGSGSAGTKRSLSAREGVREAFERAAMKAKKTPYSKTKSGLTIEDMDRYMWADNASKQMKIENSMSGGKEAREDVARAVAKFFLYCHIPAYAAASPFFMTMVSTIQKRGTGVKPPTPYEITGPLLDAEVEELKQYTNGLKNKWKTYGVTLMCDGWTGPTRLSIINFLVYSDGKTIFHKSIDASRHIQNADYLCSLMEKVIDEIGEEYVVQIVTDNGAAFKKAGLMVQEKRKHLYWTPCAAHCIDLMLEEIGKRKSILERVVEARKVTNYIYNHNWVLALMRQHTKGNLVRPGPTRFATNFISLQSLISEKIALKKMFTSEEWLNYKHSKTANAKEVEGIVLNNTFWDKVQYIVNILEPIVQVLRVVDGDTKPTMGYVYEGMRRAKEKIMSISPRSYKVYHDIIDRRWNDQLMKDIHAAAYYLNPAYHYKHNLGERQDLLVSLRKVIRTLERDNTNASNAYNQTKLFREEMLGFSDQMAVSARSEIPPAEWWFLYGLCAPDLRNIAMKLLSQTASSSGCERNWSTFQLIHTKPRNRLSAEKLDKLVYVHYNLRLKVKHLTQDAKKVEGYFDPINLSHIYEDEDPINFWIGGLQNAELDEPGDPPRPNAAIAIEMGVDLDEWMVEQTLQTRRSRSEPSQIANDDDDEHFNQLIRTPIWSGSNDDEYNDDHDNNGGVGGYAHGAGCIGVGGFARSSGSGGYVGASSGGFGGYVGGVYADHLLSQRGMSQFSEKRGMSQFSEEENFDHATQDEDHGSRLQRT